MTSNRSNSWESDLGGRRHDTSPLVAIASLGKLDLLNHLFGEVLVSPAVVFELQKPAWEGIADNVIACPFISVRPAADRNRVTDLAQMLDPGESEALALALEIRADAVLIDEHEGRRVAATLGFKSIGALGILLRAKVAGHIPAVAPELDRLRKDVGFYISERLQDEVLRLAGETPG